MTIENSLGQRRRAPGEAAGTRRENDAYDTNPVCALACVESVISALPSAPRRVLCPTAGNGAFVAGVRKVAPFTSITAVDLLADREKACTDAGANRFFARDILTVPHESLRKSDLVIDNPPFVLAEEILRHVYPALLPGASIAFLLAVTFIAGQDRWDEEHGLFTTMPLRFLIPIVPRPDFGMDTSPKFEAAMFVWTKDWIDDARVLDPIRWERPPKAKAVAP